MASLAKHTRKIKAGPKVQRRATLVQLIADTAREAWRDGTNPTLWTYEGAVTASLRSGLCLRGMGWHEADAAARDMVGEALRKAGATRPSWAEGQEAWTGTIVVRDTGCRQCGVALMPRQVHFCCGSCRATWWKAFNARSE